MAFNLFASPTADDIRVGYISPTLGYVDGVTICESNSYAKNNPGTVFIFRDGDNNLRYLNINEVNGLTPNDLRSKDDKCGGVQNYKDCGPPTIQFFGGGGIGAVGNPVIGVDGSLLAVDLVSGGHGYQYPPIVAAKDSCELGNGSVIRAILGETVDQIEVYEGEEDFEEYLICDDLEAGYGVLYGPNGEVLGPWDPASYVKIGEDPIRREVEAFQEALKNPFWTTREDQPTRVIVSDRNFATQETVEVTHPEWGEFMNKYAVSPVSPSDTIGSDNAGKVYRMEWEFNFPVSGEYIFRGLCDNTAQVFVDGASIGNLKGFTDNPAPLKKTIPEGNHNVRVDLLNVPITETVTQTNGGGELEAVFTVTGEGGNTNLMKFSFSSGDHTFTIKGNDQGRQTREVNIKLKPNAKYKITGSSTKGPVEQGIIQNGTKNKEGGTGTSNKVFADHIDSDNDNDDIQISTSIGVFRSSNKREGDGGRTTFDLVLEVPEAGDVQTTTTRVISPKSWNTNPMGVSMIIEAPQPPVPQEPLPPQIGECPPNPIWTTRFPGASQQWYPVKNERWAKFFNRYAISPVLPLDTPGSDAGGVVYRNSWDIDIPYRGFYNILAQRDATARIYVDGKLAFDVKSAGDQKWIQEGLKGKVKSQKVLIEKGRHTISVELENEVIGTPSVIDTKIFSTQDWRVSSSSPSISKDVSFKIREAGSDGSSVEIEGIFIVDEKNDGEEISKKVEVGKVYKVIARPSDRKLRSAGKILKLEDSTDNDYNDLVITASDGKFYDINGNTCKFTIESRPSNSQSPTKNGVTYSGPELFGYTEKRWSKYMNDFSVSPKVSNNVGTFTLTWTGVEFAYSGTYKFNFQADNIAKLTIGGTEILQVTDFIGEKVQYNFNLTAGKYDVAIELQNLTAGGKDDEIFEKNPMGVALFISKDVVFTDTNKTSWEDNPTGIAAILVPPPCAKKIGGKGVVVDCRVDDPGNNYRPVDNPGVGYPVICVLNDVEVEDPGINYDCGNDEIVITPSNGAELSYTCDSFGRIKKVNVLNPGRGFRVYPEIKIVSNTGVNATFRPVFGVVRDPVIPEVQESLIQVTDLVGLKQTGYVDGRVYYGAIYYDEGVPYAGFYKTAGPQTRVYATLQESITAQVVTPPSAIRRSGTDIRSNDPRLNIPGTPGSIE